MHLNVWVSCLEMTNPDVTFLRCFISFTWGSVKCSLEYEASNDILMSFLGFKHPEAFVGFIGLFLPSNLLLLCG